MREYVLVLLVAAAVTYLLTPLVRRFAVVTRAMHEPRARDTHTEPTPLLGGLAMYGGLVAGLVVASHLSFLADPFRAAGSRSEAGLLLAGGLIVVLGFIDDRWGLSAISKLAGQVAAAGVLVWSGQALPWLPTPRGGVYPLEPDLSVTLTIGVVVVTINAINFIDGLDGLAAGIVAVAALSFLAYSYTLNQTIGTTSQTVPAVASALLAGICLGFLPHNFYPARIFMGDIGAMLLGLLLAYGPISSTDSLDPALLTNYGGQALNRFPTILPLLMPAAIFIVPYTDLMFAIVRRTRAGRPVMAADRQHLHHRLMNIGHSYRQSVLIMYLWAALFSVTVVSLSVVRTKLVLFAAATAVAVLALLPVTMPGLRPWRSRGRRKAVRPAPRPAAPVPGTPAAAAHAAAAHAAAAHRAARPPVNRMRPNGPGSPAPVTSAPLPEAPLPVAPFPEAPLRQAPFPEAPLRQAPFPEAPLRQAPFPEAPFPVAPLRQAPFPVAPLRQAPPGPLPRAGRLPGADPFPGPLPFPGLEAIPAEPQPDGDPDTRAS